MTIEETILTALSAALDVPVYMEVPQSAPASYVLIEKTGGGMENCIFTATLAVQSIAASLYRAALLNDTVIDAMLSIWKYQDISRSHLNSNYNFTDTRAKEYRYQAVFDLVF